MEEKGQPEYTEKNPRSTGETNISSLRYNKRRTPKTQILYSGGGGGGRGGCGRGLIESYSYMTLFGGNQRLLELIIFQFSSSIVLNSLLRRTVVEKHD